MEREFLNGITDYHSESLRKLDKCFNDNFPGISAVHEDLLHILNVDQLTSYSRLVKATLGEILEKESPHSEASSLEHLDSCLSEYKGRIQSLNQKKETEDGKLIKLREAKRDLQTRGDELKRLIRESTISAGNVTESANNFYDLYFSLCFIKWKPNSQEDEIKGCMYRPVQGDVRSLSFSRSTNSDLFITNAIWNQIYQSAENET